MGGGSWLQPSSRVEWSQQGNSLGTSLRFLEVFMVAVLQRGHPDSAREFRQS